MMPTPAPAPPMPMQAMPAPMYLAAVTRAAAAAGSMRRAPCVEWLRSVTGVNGIVEIDAGQDGEHVGLQESDQELERGQCDHEPKRQHGSEPTGDAEPAQQRDEAREHLQGDVAGEH